MAIDHGSILIGNYKCFGRESRVYEQILPINLIIGRNNSGKSTLLDVIDYLTSPKDLSNLGHRGEMPRVFLEGRLSGPNWNSLLAEYSGPILRTQQLFLTFVVGKANI